MSIPMPVFSGVTPYFLSSRIRYLLVDWSEGERYSRGCPILLLSLGKFYNVSVAVYCFLSPQERFSLANPKPELETPNFFPKTAYDSQH